VDSCEQCEFQYELPRAENAGAVIVSEAGLLCGIVRDPANDLSRRRQPDVWSPLEYTCHVRDVLLMQRERIFEARRVECPTPVPMGREERAGYDGYAEQDPARVAVQLEAAAFMFANALARLGPDDWERTMIYNFPTASKRTLRWVAVHTEHELRHHLLDVRNQLT
jgi:hypothetical protein